MGTGQQMHKYENLLNRDFHADAPNPKWVTDISYIHTDQGPFCAVRTSWGGSAPDAGVLPDVFGYAGNNRCSYENRLDTERGHSGGKADNSGESVVSAGCPAIRLVEG